MQVSTPRCLDVNENGTGTYKDVVLQGNAFIDTDVVLDLDIFADFNVAADEDIFPQGAAPISAPDIKCQKFRIYDPAPFFTNSSGS